MTTRSKVEGWPNDRLSNIMLDELLEYQHALLNLLSKVAVGYCENEQKEDVKSVYKLLNHIQTVVEKMQSEPRPPTKKSTFKHSVS